MKLDGDEENEGGSGQGKKKEEETKQPTNKKRIASGTPPKKRKVQEEKEKRTPKKARKNNDIKKHITCKRWKEEDETRKAEEEERMKKIKEREMKEIAKKLVERLKARWTERRDRPRIGEILDKVGDWKDTELSTHMLGWLYTKTDDQIMEESEEMVNALEAVAQSSNITKAGESIMGEVVQLCTLLTTSRADIQTACSRESEDEDDGEQGHHHQEDDGQGHHHQEDDEQCHHHQEDDRDHTLKKEGAPGDKAVISAGSNGMPGSLSQASPGGTCPRTLKANPKTKPMQLLPASVRGGKRPRS